METAAYLLALTALPVWEIKTLVGYQNDSAFGRAFRDVMQMSPQAFRQSNLFRERLTSLTGYLSLQGKLVELSNRPALVFPSLANYFSPESYRVWQHVREYLTAGGLAEQDFDYYAVLHNCPNVTPGPNRYDAALVPKVGVAPAAHKFFQSQLSGGRFARYTFCCPVSEYQMVGLSVGKHLQQARWQHREGVSYFKFAGLPDWQHPDNLLIEWFLPME